jgi:hypothetical protein
MAEQDEFEIESEIEIEDESPEIEVVDDTPPEDRGKKPLPNGELEVPDDEEIATYSENVQKRIKALRRVYHDERREKERAFREQQEAISYARSVAEQNQILQERLQQGEQVLMSSNKQRAEALLAQAEREYKEAYESGDSDAIASAQRKISEIVFEKREVENYRPRFQTPLQAPEIPVNNQIPQVVPDERTRQWVTKNTWFETDSVMRGAAYGIHDELVKSGYVAGSDAYFEQIDARIREAFPSKFRSNKPANVVAPATRSASGSLKVKLTQSQVAIAKKLGIPLEKYAEQVMKESNNVR